MTPFDEKMLFVSGAELRREMDRKYVFCIDYTACVITTQETT